jgi:UDP-glucose 4-epimerase
LVEQVADGVTGTETYEIAGQEDMSVMAVAEIVQEATEAERGTTVAVDLVKNPRSDDTMIKKFGVDISGAKAALGREPAESIRDSVRQLVSQE